MYIYLPFISIHIYTMLRFSKDERIANSISESILRVSNNFSRVNAIILLRILKSQYIFMKISIDRSNYSFFFFILSTF